MNPYTTIEESKQLIEAGLDANTHDMFYYRSDSREEYLISVGKHPAITNNLFSYRNEYVIPCWSLAALLDIINDNDIPYKLKNNRKSESGYILTVKVINIVGNRMSVDFDKIIGCITLLLERDYIKSNKNE